MASEAPLWRPSPERVAAANLSAFMKAVAAEWRADVGDYEALYLWSIDHPADFWRTIWTFCGVIGEGPGARVLEDGDRMPGARWFPGARLNFAENLLRRRD